MDRANIAMAQLRALAILFLGAWVISAYPIPVECRSASHPPTISTADISQPFGHIGHVGVDYDVPTGAKVYAVMDGIVIRTQENGHIYGRYLMLLHCDGYMSLYAHLSELRVKFGDTVKSGALIALSGGDPFDNIDGDGWSSGAHLHFEVRTPGHLDNNLYNIDPLKYLELYAQDVQPLERMQ